MGAGWVVRARGSKSWTRAFRHCGLLLVLMTGCGAEPHACTLELRAPLTGDVYDADGNAIVPDRVTVAYPGSVAQECEVEPPNQGGSRFRCVEGHGTGELTAYYGDEQVSTRFDVHETDDGCHALEQEVDLKFE